MEKKTLLHAERDKKSARSGVLMARSITIKQKEKNIQSLKDICQEWGSNFFFMLENVIFILFLFFIDLLNPRIRKYSILSRAP